MSPLNGDDGIGKSSMKDKEIIPDLSIAKKFGPGMWYTIHITSLRMGEENFIEWLRITLSSIPCLKCRKHSLEYLDENHLDKFKDIHNEHGELIGMFQWTWKFHNDVNNRLGKRVHDFDEAYRMYTDESTCTDNCGN